MANGDITHVELEGFIQFGRDFPTTSTSSFVESEIDSTCDDVNREVNLILKRLGVSLPVADADSVAWLRRTKLYGAGCAVLDGLMAQDTEEGNVRAQRYCEMYEERTQKLWNSGGDILEIEKDTDPLVSSSPLLVGGDSDEQQKRFLRHPQRARADEYTNEEAVRDTGAAWGDRVRGF